jgi:hypothetical protein
MGVLYGFFLLSVGVAYVFDDFFVFVFEGLYA